MDDLVEWYTLPRLNQTILFESPPDATQDLFIVFNTRMDE